MRYRPNVCRSHPQPPMKLVTPVKFAARAAFRRNYGGLTDLAPNPPSRTGLRCWGRWGWEQWCLLGAIITKTASLRIWDFLGFSILLRKTVVSLFFSCALVTKSHGSDTIMEAELLRRVFWIRPAENIRITFLKTLGFFPENMSHGGITFKSEINKENQ